VQYARFEPGGQVAVIVGNTPAALAAKL